MLHVDHHGEDPERRVRDGQGRPDADHLVEESEPAVGERIATLISIPPITSANSVAQKTPTQSAGLAGSADRETGTPRRPRRAS